MGKCTLLFVLCFAACLADGTVAGKNWAVLIQGSTGWYNYSSQASVCHAYQMLRKAGIPEENIVVMQYDDIANNRQNPKPGTIQNSFNGTDVYKGVPKDYTGTDITMETFFAVLKGDEAAIERILGRKGKVVNSGPDDNIFIFYSDHGNVGIVAMPDGNVMTARQFNDTLTWMYENKRYGKLAFYLESCMSGSMFHKVLSPEINVYTLTASSPDHEADMIFCDNDYWKTCLGGEFACNVLGNTDFSDRSTKTLDKQYEEVKAVMNFSVPHQYGDLTIGKDTLDVFFGKTSQDNVGKDGDPRCKWPDMENHKGEFAIPISMSKIFNIKARLAQAPAHSKLRSDIEKELAAEEKLMSDTEDLFLDIAKPFYSELSESELASKIFNVKDLTIEDFDCYDDAIHTSFRLCPGLDFSYNPTAATKIEAIAHLCNEQDHSAVMQSIKESMAQSPVCQ